MSAKGNPKLNHLSPLAGANIGIQPVSNQLSPGKIQHIFDGIDKRSGRNLEKMQNDITKLYHMQREGA